MYVFFIGPSVRQCSTHGCTQPPSCYIDVFPCFKKIPTKPAQVTGADDARTFLHPNPLPGHDDHETKRADGDKA